MKTVKITANELTYVKLDLGKNPVRLEFTGLEHSVLEDIYIEGNLEEVGEWPKSLKKLTMFNSGYVDVGILPNSLERFSFRTEHVLINKFPDSIRHLLILGAESYPSLIDLPNLEYLTIRDQRCSLFDLPLGLDWLTCSPEEERPDFTTFTKLKGLSLYNAQGTIVELGDLSVDTLEIRNSSYQEIRELPDTIKYFSVVNTVLKERTITLPEELKILTFKDVRDLEGNLVPIPVTPDTVMYVNNSSVSSRR